MSWARERTTKHRFSMRRSKRSEVIGYGIDARRQRFPDETPYAYQPFVEQGLEYQWNEGAKASLHDYNTRISASEASVAH